VVVIVVVIVIVAVDGFLYFRDHSPRVLVVAAGDIADCSSKGDEATASLVEGIDGATVLAVGDLAYQHGTAEEFAECCDPT
jgi:acid phosphatase type 7